MKKLIYLLIPLFMLSGCYGCREYDYTDEGIDPTVMPPVTAEGKNTFGCLVDGWLYVGGRCGEEFDRYGYSVTSWVKRIDFIYSQGDSMYVEVLVNKGSITFCIPQPRGNKKCELLNFSCVEDSCGNGAVMISRFDKSKKIISGTFTSANGRVTNGRFDVRYTPRSQYPFPTLPGDPKSATETP